MPFKSQAQRRLFYAKAKRGEISQGTLHEWTEASSGRRLPERVKPKPRPFKYKKRAH